MSDPVKRILQQCGYPVSTVVLDVETYQDKDYSLSKLSTYEYVTDSRFEILGWAIKKGDEPATFKRELLQFNWKNITVVMHHAPFDALVLALHNQLHPPFIIDTLDLARHIEPRWSNKLADLCKRHKLPAKGDTKQFIGLHEADFDRDMWLRLVEYATNDAEREYDLLQILLPKLSNPKFELEVAAYTRNLFIKPILHFDMGRAENLKEEMQTEIQRSLKQADIKEKEARGNKSFELLLREELGSEEPPMKTGKIGPMLAIAKTDPGYLYLLTHSNDRVRHLMEARVAVRSWPLHIKRIDRLQSIFKCAQDRLPIPLKYAGAHTGRWSGSEKINPQNLGARAHPLVNQIRTLIEAPKGYMLIIIDFSQIEARVLDWLAEQNDVLQAFAEGEPVYCNFASRLTGHRIRKLKKTDSKVVAEWFGNYRQMGKIGILGCGYGMGWEHLIEYAKNTFKIDISPERAREIIKLYRRIHAMVVLFWEKVGRAFRLATQNSPQAYELTYGLRFFREGNATVIQLPSTRRLYYTGAKVEGTARYPQLVAPNPAAKNQTRGNAIWFWGGYLVENIVQAVSRDILAETVLRIENELGLRIPLIVHDDMSICVPEKAVDTYRPQIEDIARMPPTWAKELPIAVDCKISKEYIK